MAVFSVIASIVFCGMVAQDALSTTTNGIIPSISQARQAVGRATASVQDIMAIAAVIVIVLVAFFLVIPAKAPPPPDEDAYIRAVIANWHASERAGKTNCGR